MADWPIHGEITGPVVMIGFGSIGRGTLPLIERHFKYDKSRMSVIDPSDHNKHILDAHGLDLIEQHVTKENYRELLTPLLTKGGGQELQFPGYPDFDEKSESTRRRVPDQRVLYAMNSEEEARKPPHSRIMLKGPEVRHVRTEKEK